MDETLMERRARVLGPIYKQFYQAPFFPVKGEGVWVTDDQGKRYLDAYNNVPHVGHCHPHVADAVAKQVRIFNSNTRYASELIVDYAERIVATMPEPLKICMFACTGTEANELAWRIAMANSGGDGAIVTRNAFHGNSTIIGALDTSTIPTERLKPWVATVPAPDIPGLRKDREVAGPAAYAAHYDRAIADLRARGHRPAALFACPVFASDGLYSAPAGYLAPAFARVREAKGLVIADEVQSALGRTGTHFWGFEHAGFVPDLVTMAKPMGNGMPLSVIVTSRELVEGFLKSERYFNTFAGNQVVAAAGLAVLDVMEREGLQRNALDIGVYLRGRLATLMDAHPQIGDVRGTGLFAGVEMVKDRATNAPDPVAARAIIEGMMQRGVLVGITGAGRNLLKIRPPMTFSRENADLLVDTLRDTLAA
jgi:4-aminobutyrate aminotransferase-like enzyme